MLTHARPWKLSEQLRSVSEAEMRRRPHPPRAPPEARPRAGRVAGWRVPHASTRTLAKQGHSADVPDVPLNWPRPDRGASTSLRRMATGATGTRAQFWGCSPRPAALGPPEASLRGLPAAACRALTWSPFVGTSLASPHTSKPPLLRRTPVKLD